MAKIMLEEVIGELEQKLTRVLKESVKKVSPEARFDDRRLFREFKEQIHRQFNRWERIKDSSIEK